MFLTSAALADTSSNSANALSDIEQTMVAQLNDREAKILAELETHVAINTGTANIKGLDQYRGLLAAELQRLGFQTTEVSGKALAILSCEGGEINVARHLVATKTGSKSNRILLNGHMDTVFPITDEFQSLAVDEDGTIRGPGVADMKGGIVILLNALRVLDEHKLLNNANLTVLFNSDEEIGSLDSKELIEQLAGEHDVGMVFESSRSNKLARARKGLGQVRLKITGREAHAGGAHEQGVSANLELAHKVVAIEKLTDYETKNTVNVGVINGGEKRNTVSGCADAHIDLRYSSLVQGVHLQKSIQGIASQQMISNPLYPNYPTTEIWSVLHRPAKQADAKVDALIAEATAISKLVGEPITGTFYAGGGTDGSIAQAAGLPTIDSLGVDGSDTHSSREKTTVESLMARTKLVTIMLAREINRPRSTP
ncbi:MAG: M20 family metallopeptidase [Pseudomonadales bacterium]